MADFAKFGSATVEMAATCAGNCDKAGIADFLVLQQQAIQAKRIQDRIEGAKAKKQAAPAGAANVNGVAVSDPAITGEASGAMARLKAMLGKK